MKYTGYLYVPAKEEDYVLGGNKLPQKVLRPDSDWSNDVPESAQWTKDTVSVAPGERYDIEFTPDRPGKWMLHCHIPHHTTNEHVEPGGLMMVINVI